MNRATKDIKLEIKIQMLKVQNIVEKEAPKKEMGLHKHTTKHA